MVLHGFSVDLLCETYHKPVRVPGLKPHQTHTVHQSPELDQSRTQTFGSITSTLLINDQTLFVPHPPRAELAPLEEARAHAVFREPWARVQQLKGTDHLKNMNSYTNYT